MVANPYAPNLGSRDPFAVIAETPKKLEKLAAAIGARRLEKPRAPGKWCGREILCHLADCEIAFGFRFRQTLAQERHVVQPFDQEAWAKNYSGYDARAALAAFSSLRKWNLKLLKHAGAGAMGKRLTHPERGEMTFRTLVETMAGHDLNHRQQMEQIAAARPASR